MPHRAYASGSLILEKTTPQSAIDKLKKAKYDSFELDPDGIYLNDRLIFDLLYDSDNNYHGDEVTRDLNALIHLIGRRYIKELTLDFTDEYNEIWCFKFDGCNASEYNGYKGFECDKPLCGNADYCIHGDDKTRRCNIYDNSHKECGRIVLDAYGECVTKCRIHTEAKPNFETVVAPGLFDDSSIYDPDAKLSVELTYNEEGYNGDYDAEDEEDRPLLRFTVLEHHSDSRNDCTPVDDASYCTCVIANETSYRDRGLIMEYILNRYINTPRSEWKKLGEKLSHISCVYDIPESEPSAAEE